MLLFVDRMIPDNQPRRTADGYLVAFPRIARTGIQEYLAAEVGLTDRAPDAVVRVYRPEEEVFHVDALRSMAHRPITIEHPAAGMVDAATWKELAHGITGGDVVRDGDFIRVPMSIMDAKAIEAVESGKVEISAGYTADLDFTPGTTPKGEQYDAVQRNIRGNHVAIVDAARGGHQLRVIDTKATQAEEQPMPRKLIVDGINIELADTAAEVVQRFIDSTKARQTADADRVQELEDMVEELKGKLAKADEDKKTTDAQVVTLQTQLDAAKVTPAKLDQLVKDRTVVVDAAKRVHAGVVVDGRTESEIRRDVVAHVLGDACKDWDDAQISASFNTLVAQHGDGVRNTVRDHKGVTMNATDAAHAKYVERLQSAHRQQPAH